MTERFEVDGREIFVVDDVLAGAVLENFARDAAASPFVRAERDRDDEAEYVSWVRDYEAAEVRRQPYFRRIVEHLGRCFPGEPMQLTRAYASSLSYGDVAFAHRDCRPPARNVTALLYLTAGWQRDWGGETIFFTDAGEARLAFTPVPAASSSSAAPSSIAASRPRASARERG